MFWLDYTNRTGGYYEDYFTDIDVLKNYVRNGIKNFFIDSNYEIFQKEFSVSVVDDEGLVLQYRWGPHEA